MYSFMYNGDRYIYLSNGLKDITGIIDEDGELIAEYHYDGYGNCEVVNYGSSTIGDINPFRYRGYYYDEETGFYYLNSRYYDSVTGRFISADDSDYLGASGTVLSYNLFTYCENNPVNNVDYNGTTPASKIAFYIGGVIGFLVGNHVCKKLGIYGLKKVVISALISFIIAYISKVVVKKIVVRFCSNALFNGKIAKDGENLIQLLKKYYEKTKKSVDISNYKKMKNLCEEFGIKVSYKKNDILNVINHKSWDGIPHVHIGNSRIHVAITQEVVNLLLKILGLK